IYGSKKNEIIKLKNQKTRFIVFVVSVVMIVVSYAGLIYFGISDGLIYIYIFTSTIVVGTFLLFFSLSSFVLSVISNKKDFYLKDLNMFLVRQVGSKINTNFVIMSLICIMLTGSITVLSGGFGYKKAMDEELKLVTPYDVTMLQYLWEDELEDEAKKAKKFLEHKGVSIEDFKIHKSLFYYNAMINPLDMLSPYISDTQYSKYANMDGSDRTYAISESDYKYLLKMQGIEPTEIDKNEVILFTNMTNFEDAIKSFINDNESISINNKDYTFANDKPEFLSIQNSEIPRDILMVVLPDEDVNALDKKAELFVANYQENDTEINDKLVNISDNYLMGDTEYYTDEVDLDGEALIVEEILPYTRTYVYEGSQGYTATLIFVGIYIGTIFLISSAAILTLQQLSEASDNINRYTTLKSIGVEQKSIHKVIFNQIFIYFMVPFVVAITHSVVAIIVINNAAIQTATWSIILPALTGGSILIVIYGVYFYLTYKTYKSIVK
ncbi:MAG: ABC transporter permease, partial [Peptostreptococcaceae bacterium]